MTTLRIIRDGETIRALSVSGHAGFADHGQDIVCAAASVLVTTCVNALERVAGVTPALEQDEASATIALHVPVGLSPQVTHDAQIILRTALQGFEDLCAEYPKHFTIMDGRTSS